MSPKIRLASAMLVLAALACGSLGALPLGPHAVLPESERGGILAAVVDWLVSLVMPGHHAHGTHKPADIKAGSNADPNGGS